MLKMLNRNARMVLQFETVGAFASVVITFFASLYMSSSGLSGGQIGLINMVAFVSSFLCQLIAIPIVDRIGRKATILWFTFTAWSIPLLIWIFMPNFLGFLIGYTIYGTGRITFIGWYYSMTEDALEEEKPMIFGTLFLINSLVGGLTFFIGMLVGENVFSVLRIIYIIGFFLLTALAIVRHFFVTETFVGQRILAEKRPFQPGKQFLSQIRLMFSLFKNARIACSTLLYVCSNLLAAVAFIQPLFANQILNMPILMVSSIPALTALLCVVLFFVFVRRLPAGTHWKVFAFSSILYGGLALLLLLCAKTVPILGIIVLGLMGGVLYIMQVTSNSTLNFITGEDLSRLLGAVQGLTLLITAPFAWLLGKLFDIWSFLPFILIAALCVLGVLTALINTFHPVQKPSDEAAKTT